MTDPASPEIPSSYQGSSVTQMRSVLEDKPYFEGPFDLSRLPSIPNTTLNPILGRLFKLNPFKRRSKEFEVDANHLIDNQLDFHEDKQVKKIHTNGMAFIGEWVVENDLGLTGYFAGGSRGLIVVRMSIGAFELSKAGGPNRLTGIAGKIYPTLDEDESVETANFVLIESFDGDDLYFLEFQPSNNPALTKRKELGSLFEMLRHGKLMSIAEVGLVFDDVDAPKLYRTVADVSKVGLGPETQSRTPLFMKVSYNDRDRPIVKRDDFREELWETFESYGEIRLDVKVSTQIIEDAADPVKLQQDADLKSQESKGSVQWQNLGFIRLTETFLSEGADQRLRFHHARVTPKS